MVRSKFSITFLRLALTVAIPIATSAAYAQQGEDLREAAQNPIADLISLPFQNNTNFDIGHTDNTQNVLNIQPVYPIKLNPNWNLITRPILPVIYQPPFFSGKELQALEEIAGPEVGDTEFGLGDLTPEFFFSPRKPIQLGPHASLVWGAGPAFQFPTATDDLLGTGKWSAGPGFVVFLSDERLHITTGFLILNLWSFAGEENRADVNAMTLQPFLNYNLPKGWYLTTSPLITADWEADDDKSLDRAHRRWHRAYFQDRSPTDQCQHRRLLQCRNARRHWRELAIARPVDLPFPNALNGKACC
jgi:hypothetical protein